MHYRWLCPCFVKAKLQTFLTLYKSGLCCFENVADSDEITSCRILSSFSLLSHPLTLFFVYLILSCFFFLIFTLRGLNNAVSLLMVHSPCDSMQDRALSWPSFLLFFFPFTTYPNYLIHTSLLCELSMYFKIYVGVVWLCNSLYLWWRI